MIMWTRVRLIKHFAEKFWTLHDITINGPSVNDGIVERFIANVW